MALTVEDGTGLPGADSYVSLADADTYHTDHGDPSSWSGATTSKREEGLRIGTQYIDLRFSGRWKGTRVEELQALDWPRFGVLDRDDFVIDSNTVPGRLKDATSEAALRHIDGVILIPDVDTSSGIRRERVKVGSIEEDITYAGRGKIITTAGVSVVRIKKIDQLIQEFIHGSGSDFMERG